MSPNCFLQDAVPICIRFYVGFGRKVAIIDYESSVTWENLVFFVPKTGFTDGCVKLTKRIGDVHLVKYEEMEF